MMLRIPKQLVTEIRADLHRRHEFAFERVGYVLARAEGELIIALEYLPLLDSEYLPTESVGAEFSDAAITRVLRKAAKGKYCVLHTHEHGHHGRPWFGAVDRASLRELTPAFFGMSPGPHGGLLLSHDDASALVWAAPGATPVVVPRITQVGFPLSFWSVDALER